MSFYTPVPDKIVNGNLADADDIFNELLSIEQAFKDVDQAITDKDDETLTAAKTYTNTQLQGITVDGGTY